jgi:hypothetical protein
MNAEKLSRAIGEIDAKYIEEAEGFTRTKKQIFLRRAVAMAACLAIFVSVLFSGNFLYLMAQAPGGFTIMGETKKPSWSFGSSSATMPSLRYWDGAVKVKAYVNEGTYKPGEAFEIYLELGRYTGTYVGDVGNCNLVIEVSTEEFFVESSYGKIKNGELIIEDYTSGTNETADVIKLTFTPNFEKDWASGKIGLRVMLEPENINDFISRADEYMVKTFSFPRGEHWTESFIDNGRVTVSSEGFKYAFDGVEMWLAKNSDMLLEKMIMNHYDTWRISGREFMRIYYEYLYSDNVFASVTQYMEAEKTFKFEYISKNIRYEKTEFISNDEIWAISQEIWNYDHPGELPEKQMKRAQLFLEYMLETGVITEAEYKNELIWLSEASTVGNMQAAYPGKIGDYAHKLRKYIYTHRD